MIHCGCIVYLSISVSYYTCIHHYMLYSCHPFFMCCVYCSLIVQSLEMSHNHYSHKHYQSINYEHLVSAVCVQVILSVCVCLCVKKYVSVTAQQIPTFPKRGCLGQDGQVSFIDEKTIIKTLPEKK